MKALELANALDKAPYSCGCTNEVAAELRRLAEVNEELLDILGRLVEADRHQAIDGAMFAYAKKFLAKSKEQQ